MNRYLIAITVVVLGAALWWASAAKAEMNKVYTVVCKSPETIELFFKRHDFSHTDSITKVQAELVSVNSEAGAEVCSAEVIIAEEQKRVMTFTTNNTDYDVVEVAVLGKCPRGGPMCVYENYPDGYLVEPNRDPHI